MVTGPKPYISPYLALHLRIVGRVLAAVLAAAPAALAPVQVQAQAVRENGELKAAAPNNFVMHDAPGPGVVLRFEDSEAQQHSLADFQGKTVLLNIWATWCRPCLREIPALDRLAAALKDANVAVVAVSIDRKGINAVRKAFEDLEVQRLAAFIDPSGEALRTVRGMGLPMSLLIDGEGREIGRIVGPAAWDEDAAVAFFRQAGRQPQQKERSYDGPAAPLPVER
jgi:thiol-disulfide isomerase/thioredoxin